MGFTGWSGTGRQGKQSGAADFRRLRGCKSRIFRPAEKDGEGIRGGKRKAGLAVAVMTFLISVAAGAYPVFATGTTSSVTFTNEPTNQPDLYITKETSCTVDGYTAPADTEFTFTLKWDQDGDGTLTYAAGEEYSVYDENGALVYQYDESGNVLTWTTSSSGKFTLTGEQTARFEWAGTGTEYEITEASLDGWTQISPSGGAAAGYVDVDGTLVTFQNAYTPVTSGSGETTLKIEKQVSWPDGYVTPDVVASQEFTFNVTVDGTVYSGKTYTLYDGSTGEIAGTGTTDSKGTLTIGAGQYALFENVEVGADYTVAETEPDGWEAAGSSSVTGGTTAPLTYVYFENKYASFLVTKDVEYSISSGADQEFTFYLTDSNGDALTQTNPLGDEIGIYYYLYDADGNLIDKEGNVIDASGYPVNVSGGSPVEIPYITDISAGGSFSLRDGWQAVFVGVAAGTVYNVTEEDVDHWYSLPSGGYTAQTVKSILSTLSFTNTQLTGTVTITKKDESGSLLRGVTYELYDASGNLLDTQMTNRLGKAVFSGIAPSSEAYMIYETATQEGYTLLADGIEVTIPCEIAADDVDPAEVDVTGSDVVLVTNIYGEEVYRFYSLFYEVTDSANFSLPATGGVNGWVLLGLIGCGILAVGIVFIFGDKWKGRRTGEKDRIAMSDDRQRKHKR